MVDPPAEQLPIAWQNTVVDIYPTSRYDPTGETPDTAIVSTTIGLLAGGGVRTMQLTAAEPVFRTEPGDDSPYRITVKGPQAWAGLVKGSDLSVVVFLPRIPPSDPVIGLLGVRLVDYTREGDPVVFADADGPGRRSCVGWHWSIDPDSIVDYIYERIAP